MAEHPTNPTFGGLSFITSQPVGKSAVVVDTVSPTVTFSPADAATNVTATSNITITFNEAVRNTDDSALTDSNVDALITLKDTNSSGSNIAFNATIDGPKKVITINPTSNLSSEQTVYVAIGATVEDASDNAISATNATFTVEELFATVTFKLYWDTTSDSSQLDADSNFEYQVFEVNNNTDRNWVRTIVDHTGTLTDSTLDGSASTPGVVITSTAMSLNVAPDKYYVVRGTYDDSSNQWSTNYMSGMALGYAEDGSGYSISQAPSYSEFEGYVEQDITTASGISLGTGFPTARYDSGVQYDMEFVPDHDGSTGDPIWIWLAVA